MILVKEDITNSYGSIRQACGATGHRRLALVWASQFMRDGTKSVAMKSTTNSINTPFSTWVWQESTLSSASLCVALWSSMSDLMGEMNKVKLDAGFILYADDILSNSTE